MFDKIYGERVRRFTARIENVLFDAYRRMDRDREERELQPPLPEEVDLISWPQLWPDWGCGFAGDWRQEPCTEQTNVVYDRATGGVYVYHAGKFVRRVEAPGEAFWQAVRNQSLPGATDTSGWATLAPKPDA